MTGFEWFIACAIIIGFVAKIASPIWDSQKKKVKSDATRDFIDSVIRAAEELDVSGQLGGKTKSEWVFDKVNEKYPELAEDLKEYEIAVNAAVQAAGLGAAGKKAAGLLAGKIPKK